jgi:hypothetical protein
MRHLIAALCFVFASQSSQAACMAEKAVYTNLEDQEFTLSFSKQENPKSWSNIQTTLKTPLHKYDFEFTASNGYSMQYMVLLTKGVKQDEDIVVDFFDANIKSLLLPNAGEAAPEYVFSSKLGLWLNYANAKDQEYLPRGMFKLSQCRN